MAKRSPQSIPSGIFTQQDHTELLQHLDALSKWLEDCQRAKSCGVDVSGLQQIRDELVIQLTAIRDNFMPGR